MTTTDHDSRETITAPAPDDPLEKEGHIGEKKQKQQATACEIDKKK